MHPAFDSASSHTGNRRATRKDGFALILALGLMTLMVLLALTLSALIAVEAEASRQAIDTAQARQNALVGLMTALGQIQKAAGPDTRVSARSDILSSTVTTDKWTGIWKTEGDTSATFTSSTCWLVSAMNPDPTQAISTTATTSVLMARAAEGLGSLTHSAVYAVKQPITPASTSTAKNASNPAAAGNSGYYAYWVSDESLKAKFSIPNAMEVLTTPTVADKLTSMQVPRNYAFEFADDGFAGYRKLDQTTLSRLTHPAQLAFLSSLSGIATVPRSLLHDVTFDSQGILANARDGGLKLDLTTGFDNNTIFSALFAAGKENYRLVKPWRTPNYKFTNLGRGPHMVTLRDFSRFYKRLNADGSFTFELASSGGEDVSNEPSRASTSYAYVVGATTGMDPQKNMVFPIISHVQVSMGLRPYLATTSSTAGPLYGLRSETRLLVGLYNPYNIPLTYAFSATRNVRIECDMLPYVQLRASKDDGSSEVLSWDGNQHLGNVRFNKTNETYFQFIATIDANVLIPPGQIIAYSLKQTSTTGISILQPGYSANGYFYQYLGEETFPARKLSNTVQILKAGIVSPSGYNPGQGSKQQPQHGSVKFRSNDGGKAHWFSELQELWRNTTDESALPAFREGITDLVTLGDLQNPDGSFDVIPIGTWGYHLRHTLAEKATRVLVDGNLRYFTGSIDWDRGTAAKPDFDVANPYIYYNESRRGLINTQFDEFADMSAWGSLLWGNSTGASGQSSVVLFHLPRRPPLSIGEFQNATLGSYANEPSYVLGNSYANPRLSRTATASSGENTSTVFDISYLVNDGGIWDNYFLSGLSDTAGSSWISWKNDAVLQAHYADPIKRPLPNHRLTLAGRDGVSQPGVSQLFSDTTDGYRAMAAYLRLNGPFNVNSTSVPAWKALLMSLRNLDIPKLNTAGVIAGFHPKSAEKSAYVRTVATKGDDTDFWNGYRALSEDEAQTLAERIVEGVKARARSKGTPAPFQSMAEFVNRRLSTDDYGKSGVLQTAIDEANINRPGGNSSKVSSVAGWNVNTQDEQAAAFPGMLTQGDLLQGLAAVMSVRSDTFKIRAYGEHRGPDGRSTQAWCEAIVQRTADFVDTSLKPGATPSEISNNITNREYGRRFKIVSVRWLDPAEL